MTIDKNVLTDNISDCSKIANRIFFTYIGFIIYIILSLFLTTDAELIIDEVARLPIVNIEIRLTYFFSAASILAILLFTYFQLYHYTNKKLITELIKQHSTTTKYEVYPWLINILEFKSTSKRVPEHLIRFLYNILSWGLLPLFLIYVSLTTLKKHDIYVTALSLLWLAIGIVIVITFIMRNRPAKRKGNKILASVIITVCIVFTFFCGTIVFKYFNNSIPKSDIIKNMINANLEYEKLVSEKDLEYKTLFWVDLSNKNLMSANLQGAILKKANLQGANLVFSNMQSVNLQYANLEKANLKKATLQGADLSNTNLNSSNLYGTELISANLYNSSLRNAELYHCTGGHTNTVFNHSDLYSAVLTRSNFDSARFIHADLQYAFLDTAFFQYTIFDSCNIIETHFEESQMRGASFIEAKGSQPFFNNTKLSDSNFQNVKLVLSDFRDADLTGSYFINAMLLNSKFNNTILNNVDFTNADLRGCEGLTVEQLGRTKSLVDIKLDKDIYYKVKSQYPKLFIKPKSK